MLQDNIKVIIITLSVIPMMVYGDNLSLKLRTTMDYAVFYMHLDLDTKSGELLDSDGQGSQTLHDIELNENFTFLTGITQNDSSLEFFIEPQEQPPSMDNFEIFLHPLIE